MTPRVERLKKDLINSKPHLDVERAYFYTKGYKKNQNRSIVYRTAKGLEAVLNGISISILPDEIIVGDSAKKPRAAAIYPEICGGWLEKELDSLASRENDPLEVSEDDKKILREEIFPYWRGKSVDERVFAILPMETKSFCYADPEEYPPAGTAILQNRNQTTNYVGNTFPNYKRVLEKGFKGIIEDIKNRLGELEPVSADDLKKIDFLESTLVTSEAAIHFANRYSKEAKKLASKEKDKKRKDELNRIAEITSKVPESPAEGLQEAIQSLWFVHLITRLTMNGNAFALGRIDQLLQPYYEADVKKGGMSKEKALEFIECFYVKIASVNILRAHGDAKFFGGYAIWNLVTLGGQNRQGNDATNDMSYLCLEAMKDVQLVQPDMVIRIHNGTPQQFYIKTVELLRLGLGHPKYQSDEIIIPYLQERGIDLEEARDYVPTSCVEARTENEGNYLTAVYLNFGAAVELVFNRGVLKINGRNVGIDTGKVEEFKSFDDFKAAYDKQMEHMCKHAAIASAAADVAKRELLAAPFYSSMREDCIERAEDVWTHGAKHNDGGGYWSAVGFADTANSLSVIKKLVFEEKKLTMGELKSALDKNFEGMEPLRKMLINRAPKWGNDDDYVDNLAQHVLFQFGEECHKYRNGLGGKYQPEITTLTANIPFGAVIGALPSGKKAWAPLSDGISPEPNTEKEGVVGAIKSASKLFQMPKVLGTLHNMKFTPTLLEDLRGMENFASLLKSYMVDLRGWHAQFNVVKGETLKDAQANPENYPHLIVKVAGYSAYFAELDKAVQDEIIGRTEYACAS